MKRRIVIPAAAVLLLAAGALLGRSVAPARAQAHGHADHGPEATSHSAPVAQDPDLPADGAAARARLAASPRHAEWATVRSGQDSIRAWVVYPERADKAPVVVVIHEIFGLSLWIQAVADQLAREGFIAIAPDLLTMKNVPTDSTGQPDGQAARAAIAGLQRADVHRHIKAVADYGMTLPAAKQTYGIVGFCWGGSASFMHAVESPELGASVVYYGSAPAGAELPKVRAPVLGLYGGNDARVNASIPPADSAMRALGKTYQPHIFEGAGHGFLRQQSGQEGANLEATKRAWPLTVAWFRQYL